MKKAHIFYFLFFQLLAVDLCFAQSTMVSINLEVHTYTQSEKSAQPEGGLELFYKYFGRNVRYPKSARDAKIEGTVLVEFTVTKEGNLTDFKVIKSIHKDCDSEPIRLLKEGPVWNPAIDKGEPVDVRLGLEVHFDLGN